jgi:hypothetical protein
MKRRFILLGLLIFITLPLACNSDNTARKTMTTNDPMTTYPIGRFSISVPQSMKRAARTASLRYRDLRETTWEANISPETARNATWKKRIAEIETLQPPEGKLKAVIETRTINEIKPWCDAILYYGDRHDDETVSWDVLLDAGRGGLWIQWSGLERSKEKMLGFSLDIARAYKVIDPAAPPPKENGFYLEHGYIALPYLEQEETYARFEGHPLGLKLEFKTTAVHKVSESGLVDRLAASLAMNFAPGVDIDKLHTGKRTVAGIAGEEVIMRGTQDGKSELNFIWLFTGKADSGDAPKISIEMEAPDGRVEEKLKVWDTLLDSIKPVGR